MPQTRADPRPCDHHVGRMLASEGNELLSETGGVQRATPGRDYGCLGQCDEPSQAASSEQGTSLRRDIGSRTTQCKLAGPIPTRSPARHSVPFSRRAHRVVVVNPIASRTMDDDGIQSAGYRCEAWSLSRASCWRLQYTRRGLRRPRSFVLQARSAELSACGVERRDVVVRSSRRRSDGSAMWESPGRLQPVARATAFRATAFRATVFRLTGTQSAPARLTR